MNSGKSDERYRLRHHCRKSEFATSSDLLLCSINLRSFLTQRTSLILFRSSRTLPVLQSGVVSSSLEHRRCKFPAGRRGPLGLENAPVGLSGLRTACRVGTLRKISEDNSRSTVFYWRRAFSTTRRGKLHYAFTSGTFGTMLRRGGPSSPPGGLRFGGERRLALARRGSGSFSGRGLTGPSG